MRNRAAAGRWSLRCALTRVEPLERTRSLTAINHHEARSLDSIVQIRPIDSQMAREKKCTRLWDYEGATVASKVSNPSGEL